MTVRRTVLLLVLLSLGVAACQAPSAKPGTSPEPPGGMERPVQIYLAGDPPALQVTSAVEMVTSMADLKALVGDSPRAIWVDVAVEPLVDTEWLRERYKQGWPLFVFGKGAHDSLLRMVGLSTEKAQLSVAAYRQRSRGGADMLGVWASMPAVQEVLALSAELLADG